MYASDSACVTPPNQCLKARLEFSSLDTVLVGLARGENLKQKPDARVDRIFLIQIWNAILTYID